MRDVVMRTFVPAAAALVVVVAASCQSQVATPPCTGAACKKDDTPAEPPRIFVDPPFGLGFDCVELGCSTEKHLSVENRGGGVVRIVQARLSIDASLDFTLERADGEPLPVDVDTAIDIKPDEPLDLVVRYAPTDGDTDAGDVELQWVDGAVDFEDAVSEEVTLPLTTRTLGSAVASLSTTRLNFGLAAQGDTVTQDVVITNTGTAGILSVGPIALLDGDEQVFHEPTPGAWETKFANPGDEIHFPVAFSPNAVDAFLGTLSLTTNDGGTPVLTVQLAGTSLSTPKIDVVSGAAIDFGDLRVGTTRTETVEVRNLGGAVLDVTAAVRSGANLGLSVNPTTPTQIAPLESAFFAAQLTPTRGGAFDGALSFTSSDPQVRITPVDVTADVSAPAIAVSPSSGLNFGNLVLGWISEAQTLQITNTGFGELTINTISFDVGSSTQITLTNVPALPIKLSPGDPPVEVTALVNAQSLGDVDATLLIGSDSVDGATASGGVSRVPLHARVVSCAEGCPFTNGTPECSSGSCQLASCTGSFHDANRNDADGCECNVDLQGSVRRDVDDNCPGVNIGPIGDNCAQTSEVRRSGNTLHASIDESVSPRDPGDVDIWFFHATDDSQFFGCDFTGDSFGILLRLEGAPAGMRLCAHQGANGTGCGGDNQRTCGGQEVRFSGGNQLFGGSDTSDITVWVEWAPGSAPQCGSYTLFAKANNG